MLEFGEGEIDQRAHGLGAEAPIPELDAEPIADLGRGIVIACDAAGADRHAVAGRDQKGDLALLRCLWQLAAAMKSSASARE